MADNFLLLYGNGYHSDKSKVILGKRIQHNGVVFPETLLFGELVTIISSGTCPTVIDNRRVNG